jgi:hypothetical protein
MSPREGPGRLPGVALAGVGDVPSPIQFEVSSLEPTSLCPFVPSAFLW